MRGKISSTSIFVLAVLSLAFFALFPKYAYDAERNTFQIPNTLRNDIHILIDKSEYRLYLMDKKEILFSFPVVFGFEAEKDKLFEGDGCTPIGEFSIRALYPHAKWNYFLWIDYPTEESWTKHNAAKASGKIKSNAGIGGEIGIHGVPEGKDSWITSKTNWTLGCISLKNADIEKLYSKAKLGTVVVIQP